MLSIFKKNNRILEDRFTSIEYNIENYEKINISKDNQLNEFFEIIQDIISNDTVKQMKNYRQHCNTSCYQHCMQVAYFTYVVCKKMKLDYVSATRAAMIHDLFLYDWRKKYRTVKLSGLHAFVHPKIALENADKLFHLNELEKDVIVKHMWPVTFSLPKYKESYIVTFMDKYSACIETYNYITNNLSKKTFYRYAYIFLSMIFFRIV